MTEASRTALRKALGNRADCYRTVTLYSTEEPTAEGWTRARTADATGWGCAGLLTSSDPYRPILERAEQRLPRVITTSEADPRALKLQYSAESFTVRAVRTWLFSLPHGGLVAGLELGLEDLRAPGRVRALDDLLRDLDGGRHSVTIDGRPILEVATGGVEQARGTVLGSDMHHLMFPPARLTKSADHIDRDFAQRLVSRRDDSSREGYHTVRLPTEANRYADTLVALTPGATAAAGHRPDFEVVLVLCAVQALASLSSLRQIQNAAFEALREFQQESDHRLGSEALERRLHELGQLELALSFGVEAYLGMRTSIPTLPVEQYHSELVDALGLPPGASITGGMLQRLSKALQAEGDARATRRARAVERQRQNWSAVGGAAAFVALPLSILVGFLGMSAKEIDARASFLDSRYLRYYAAIVGVLGLAGLLARFYVRRVAQRQEP